MKADLKRKSNERTLGHYFLKIADGLPRDCGERPHLIKINEQSALADNYQTEDSLVLKKTADKLTEKIEIIGHNILNQNKFKYETLERLEKIEETLSKCFTSDSFRESQTVFDEKVMKYVNTKLGNF